MPPDTTVSPAATRTTSATSAAAVTSATSPSCKHAGLHPPSSFASSSAWPAYMASCIIAASSISDSTLLLQSESFPGASLELGTPLRSTCLASCTTLSGSVSNSFLLLQSESFSRSSLELGASLLFSASSICDYTCAGATHVRSAASGFAGWCTHLCCVCGWLTKPPELFNFHSSNE